MANLDVTELLSDPDFVDPCTLIHRQSVMNADGTPLITEQQFPTVGSVQPASGKTLNRLPDELRIAGIMSFFIKGAVITDGCGAYPDVIVFRKQRYQVQVVFDWTNWGAGWCEGTCVREKAAI